MKCCISSCKMYSDRRSYEMKGVTFHSLSSEDSVRKQWLTSIGRKNWNPSKHTKICSNHFNKEEFYVTGKGFRKIKVGAVPCLKLDDPELNASKTESQNEPESSLSQVQEDKLSPYQHNQFLKLKTLQNKHRRLLKRYASLEQQVKNMRNVPNGTSQDREIIILHKRNVRLRDKNKMLIAIIKKLKRCINNGKVTSGTSVCEVCNASLVFISSDDKMDINPSTSSD